jgi:outer membrane lipoprotein-sorting protein
MAAQVLDFSRHLRVWWVAVAVIGIAGATGCGEVREADVSAYERLSHKVADTVRTVDSTSSVTTSGEESPPSDDRVSESADPAPPVEDLPPEAGGTPAGDAPSESGQEVDVDLLLRIADEAYAALPSLRASFHQVIDVPLLERRREGHGTWYQKGRSRFKMDFDDPPEDEIVADGTYLWLFYPSTNPRQVIRSRLGASGTGSGTADVLARILEEARTNYEGQYVGSETLDGVTTHIVSLRPTTRSQYRLVRVWIAARDNLVRKFEITEENETVRTVTLAALEPGATLPDSLFRFVPPADTDVFEG